MDLELTPEQHELRSLAAELLGRRVPPEVPRAYLEGGGDASGLWDELAELGWYCGRARGRRHRSACPVSSSSPSSSGASSRRAS